jgi:transcriptional regulator with XRE-family HTH domain
MAGFSTTMLEAGFMDARMKAPESAEFWQRVLARLDELGKAQGRKLGPSWVEDETGISLTMLRKYRLGISYPSIARLKKIASAVGASAEDLYPDYMAKLAGIITEDDDTTDEPVVKGEREQRFEAEVSDSRWRDAVKLYLKTEDGISTPGYVVPDLLEIPYRHLHLRPDVLADVHTARQLLQRQLSPAAAPAKTADRPDLEDAVDQPKPSVRMITPRAGPKPKR